MFGQAFSCRFFLVVNTQQESAVIEGVVAAGIKVNKLGLRVALHVEQYGLQTIGLGFKILRLVQCGINRNDPVFAPHFNAVAGIIKQADIGTIERTRITPDSPFQFQPCQVESGDNFKALFA